MPIFLFLAVGAGLLYMSEAIKFKDQLQYNFTGSKFDLEQSQETGFAFLFLTLQMNLVNETSFAVGVKQITFNIIHAGKVIGTVQGVKAFDIAANKKTPVTFAVKIPTANIFDYAKKIVQDYIEEQKIYVTLDGTIKLALASIPFKENIQLI